jgi:hypothetical protein
MAIIQVIQYEISSADADNVSIEGRIQQLNKQTLPSRLAIGTNWQEPSTVQVVLEKDNAL